MTVAIKALKKRREAAAAERDAFQPLLDECYQYVIPYRKSTRDTGKGEKRANRVFDHTAPTSVMRAAGRLQQDLVPPGFFRLELGPIGKMLAKTEEEQKPLLEELGRHTNIIASQFDGGEWDNAFHEMAVDLQAGTGAMLILEGDDDRPVRFVTVAIEEVLLEGGPFNDISGVFWTRKWPLRALRDAYPEAKFGAKLEEIERQDAEKEVQVHFDTTFDVKKKRWSLLVWCEEDEDAEIHKATSKTCPWITPRYYRVPGETYGRGPIMLAMPTIKTINTAQKLTLQGAAIAMLGIYTAIDDGVFNPDQSPIEPGVFWKVARNGGVLGPSVSKFPEPRIDLSNIITQDLRMAIQSVLMDQSLPADGAAVRSATEIMERVKRLSTDYTGAFGRLVSEIVVPVVRRVLEILYRKKLISTDWTIDQLLVRVNVVSPLARARQMQELQAIAQFIELVASVDPAMTQKLVRLIPALLTIARALGVPEDLLASDEQRAAMAEQEQQAMEAQAMLAAAPAVKDVADAAVAVDAAGA